MLIANLLQDWGLIKLQTVLPIMDNNVEVVVIPFVEKADWICKSKYALGAKKSQLNTEVLNNG